MNEPNIPETVTREAKIYFTVIATTHLLTMIMFAATRGYGACLGREPFSRMRLGQIVPNDHPLLFPVGSAYSDDNKSDNRLFEEGRQLATAYHESRDPNWVTDEPGGYPLPPHDGHCPTFRVRELKLRV